MSRTWVDIGSDVNWREYGGLWARHVGGTTWHVIWFMPSSEYERGRPGYMCELCEVDTASKDLPSALQCCGYAADQKDERGDPLPPECLVHALHCYGARDKLWDDIGPNAHKLVRAAKRYSR